MFGGYYTGQPFGGQSDGMNFTVTLVVSDTLQAHAADNITLTQQHLLTIANALQSITDGGPLTIVEAKTLVMADALHGHAVDNISLIQQHVLAIANALHAHTADSLALMQLQILAIQDALQGQVADNVFVSISSDLVVQGASQGMTSDNITIGIHIKLKPTSPNIERRDPSLNTQQNLPRISIRITGAEGNTDAKLSKPRMEIGQSRNPHGTLKP